MIRSNRTARAKLRDLRRANSARRGARRAVATGRPQPMRTHLLARGLDPKLAKNYAGAVSRKVTVAADQVERPRKLKGRVVALFPTYVYTARQVDRALRAYTANGGPKRPADRAAFLAVAA